MSSQRIHVVRVAFVVWITGFAAPLGLGQATSVVPRFEPDHFGGYASDHIIVKASPNAALAMAVEAGMEPAFESAHSQADTGLSSAVRAKLQRWSIRGIRPALSVAPQNHELAGRYGLDRYFVIEVPPETDPITMAADFAEARADIEEAGVDAIGGVGQELPTGTPMDDWGIANGADQLIPNDPSFALQWNMHNTGQMTGWVPDADIDAPEAWNLHTGSSSITVADVGSGVFPHQEFSARMVPGRNVVFGKDPNETGDGCPHATFHAGIIAATGDNGIGIAGISWEVKIMPVKVLSGCSGTVRDTVSGIIWATDNGAQVINIGLQFYGLGSINRSLLQDALNYAHDLGLVSIACAGSILGVGVAYPGALEPCVAVSATDAADTFHRPGGSNFGPQIDLSAPGRDVYSTTVNDQYALRSGTAVAAAHVSGVAALVWSYHPEYSNVELLNALKLGVDDLGPMGWDERFGHGRINAYLALTVMPELLVGACCYQVEMGNCIDEMLSSDCTRAGGRFQGTQSTCGGVCAYPNNGDINGDGQVDINDLPHLTECLSGPGGGYPLPNCNAYDFESDNDADAEDVAEFQNAVGQ